MGSVHEAYEEAAERDACSEQALVRADDLAWEGLSDAAIAADLIDWCAGSMLCPGMDAAFQSELAARLAKVREQIAAEAGA